MLIRARHPKGRRTAATVSALLLGLVAVALSLSPARTIADDARDTADNGAGEMAVKWDTLDGRPPVIIAHRGASGYLPEHTLEGYERAIELGADYIEPDLVITKDGVLVVRHDNYLSTTTDVADHPEFAGRYRKQEDFGKSDWWVEDFTLAEIKTLRARQAFPGRSTEFDGGFEIPTFDEVAALARRKSAETGREIGLYPETKHPAHFKALGLDFVVPLLATLERHGYGGAGARVFIQSFEPGILRELRGKTPLPLVMLVEPLASTEPGAESSEPNIPLEEIATFADAVGPYKGLLLVAGEDGSPVDSGFVARAHELGLRVHPWTFRSDALPEVFADPDDEYRTFFGLGIDGLFSDFSDAAVAARGVYGR